MSRQLYHKTVKVDGVEIFYREAGDKKNPSLLLLHGFPTSSLMFKNLMTVLSDRYHLIAPDYPGFGFSDFPLMKDFDYSFDNIASCMNAFTKAIRLQSFTIYLHDYGCPIGLRICLQHPEKIEKIIVQNGNAYQEGLGPQWNEVKDYWKNPTPEKKKKVAAFLSKEGTKEQYFAGLPKKLHQNVSPESWIIDWQRMSRPRNIAMQFKLNCTYQTNIKMFPAFQDYFRKHQPKALVIWGKYDVFFDVAEAHCYKKDLPKAEVHILEGGHMALETNFEEVVQLIERFMSNN
ncbi:alpha/beta hydrolase [Flavobacterium sp. WW92]|uniref:alpha/beta fold hydrolase n=1 Tax=Flavobacterium sp. WW92 TaxID=1454066 RepID=UPI0023797138|nr:alpha/beta hydrolase [Flavobacterium sp. WW92]WDO14543.1 alpha/beta hydrolase [Flavobacterium sp. WW92]